MFSGCSDASTLDYVSCLLGEEGVQPRSTSYNVACGPNRKSVNESPQRESPRSTSYVQFEPGRAVLVRGTLRPICTPVDGGWSPTRVG